MPVFIIPLSPDVGFVFSQKQLYPFPEILFRQPLKMQKTKARNGSDGIKTLHWPGKFRIFRSALYSLFKIYPGQERHEGSYSCEGRLTGCYFRKSLLDVGLRFGYAISPFLDIEQEKRMRWTA
jgi:hypothetical protein